MTNTKPTWEEEFDKEFTNNCGGKRYSLPCEDPMCDTHHALIECIKSFIQKVHDEAYERGYNDGEKPLVHGQHPFGTEGLKIMRENL